MMKKVDRLILGEIFGPWAFGVAIFTVLIMAGSFLFKFTELLSQGVPVQLVLKLTVLLLPGILAKTFSMAMLLGTLLAFGRLSGDSEIVALRAGGVSIVRIMLPIAVFGILVSLVTYIFTDYVVPAASIQATGMQSEFTKSLDSKSLRPTAQPIYDNGQLVGQLVAKDFSIADRTLTGVDIVTYNKEGYIETLFSVPKLTFDDIDKWSAQGESILYILKDNVKITFQEGVWPDTSAKPTSTPEDMIARNLRDLDSFSSRELKEQITKLSRDKSVPRGQVINLEFGFWNKFALPLAALVFGLVGAPLGIRSHRAGTATGFALSILIIFCYMLMTNTLAMMAQNGVIPAVVASFGPIVIGTILAIELIRRKNVQ